MEKINNVLDRVAAPLSGVAEWLLRLGLGISFFLHGYGKLQSAKALLVGWLPKECLLRAQWLIWLLGERC